MGGAVMGVIDVTGERIEWDPPTVLPAAWKLHTRGSDGARYQNVLTGALVIVSCSREMDGRRWVHFSMSRPTRVPSWSELREAKDLFLGREVYAYQVLPPQTKYVNINPNVLHLWCCLDAEPPLPDFTRGTSSL
jgi:hypothetical protein